MPRRIPSRRSQSGESKKTLAKKAVAPRDAARSTKGHRRFAMKIRVRPETARFIRIFSSRFGVSRGDVIAALVDASRTKPNGPIRIAGAAGRTPATGRRQPK